MSVKVTIGVPPDEVTVGQVMHPGVIVAAPESPLRYVARLMARHRVHAVVIIGDDEEGGAWGIVSDTDLLSAILRGGLDKHTAGSMARTQIVTVSRGDSVERAARLMGEHALTHLLVVAGAEPVGVISTLDLARAAAAGSSHADRSVEKPRSDMYKTVIWATDGSDGADTALAEARRLVDSRSGRIVAAHCDQRLTGRAMEWPALADEDDLRVKIGGQVDELRNDGFKVDLVVRRSHREPADMIAAIAEEFRGDVIVCGTRGRGAFSGAFFGSFTQRLLHVAHCPVLAIPRVEIRAQPKRAKEEVRA